MAGIDVLKGATEIAVSVGVGTIVGNLAKSTLQTGSQNILKRISVGIGGFALGSYVGDLAATHMNTQIDAVVEQIVAVRAAVREAKQA